MSDDKPLSKSEKLRQMREENYLRNSKRDFLPPRKPHEINPFEDAARGRDPAPKSSDGGVESRTRATDGDRKPSAVPSSARGGKKYGSSEGKSELPARVAPGPSEGKPKFDRNQHHREYMKEYMRRRRAEQKGK